MKYSIFGNSRADNSKNYGQILPKNKLDLDLKVKYILCKKQFAWRRNERARVVTRWNIAIFDNSRADNSGDTGRIFPKINLDLDLKVKHILCKNQFDWRRNENARVVTRWNIAIFENSRADNSGNIGPIFPKIEVDLDLKVKHILCKNQFYWIKSKSDSFVTRWIIAIFVIQGQIILEIQVGFFPELNLTKILWPYTSYPSFIMIGQGM